MATTRTNISTYLTGAPGLVRVVTHTMEGWSGQPDRLLGRIEVDWQDDGFRLMFDHDNIDTAECLAHTLLAAVAAAREAFSEGPGSDRIVGVPVAFAVTDEPITTANAHTHPAVVGNPS